MNRTIPDLFPVDVERNYPKGYWSKLQWAPSVTRRVTGQSFVVCMVYMGTLSSRNTTQMAFCSYRDTTQIVAFCSYRDTTQMAFCSY